MKATLFYWYRRVVWFWYAKVLGRDDTVCHPACGLCEVQGRVCAHYETCGPCLTDYPCGTMDDLRAEEDVVVERMFPEVVGWTGPTNGTTSSVPVVELQPWDWSKTQ